MSWLRIDDKFARHPKIEALTDREFRTWIGILCYCAEYRNQGLIYKQTIGRAVHGATPGFLNRCVDLGLLDPTTASNGLQEGVHFLVHDFTQYNGSSDPQAAERMRKYRETHPRVSGGKWERTREEVFERDAGVCVDCGEYTDDWNADHEPDRAELTKRGLSIYDLAYIQTRCHSCHAKKTRRVANRPNQDTEPTDRTDQPGSEEVRPPSRGDTRARPVPSPRESPEGPSPLQANGALGTVFNLELETSKLIAACGGGTEAATKLRRTIRAHHPSEHDLVDTLRICTAKGAIDPLSLALAEIKKRGQRSHA